MRPRGTGPTRCSASPSWCCQRGGFQPPQAAGPQVLRAGCPSGGTTPQSPPRTSDLPGVTWSSRSSRPPFWTAWPRPRVKRLHAIQEDCPSLKTGVQLVHEGKNESKDV
ncbi:hypothetical protein NDU88_004320 [Pleurodeles waltl]|uniref:Uncharacterized protein n=1 Tax=Pleurodeles waltl TaxID=8319 RepID=A0AAV7LJF9_PLEWA|nr:hypothetical protein NDU88_004320 [Pleurodeles waltl]